MSHSEPGDHPPLPAIVFAGDGRAAKAIYGESKVYLEIGSRPMVASIVLVLQQVPEVSEVWVVGNAERLEGVLGCDEVQSQLSKPLHIVPQFRSLYENGLETYRRLLPGAGPSGRDPEEADLDLPILYLSGDLPFATHEEISVFVQRALDTGVGYALGLVPQESLGDFTAREPGGDGIDPAMFNLREGRFRQSNLHLLRPGRIVNRFYIEDMYEHRYQKDWGNIASLAWELLRSQQGGLAVVYYYSLMHLGGIANRLGLLSLANRIRAWVPSRRIEIGCSGLLGTPFRFVYTEAGGCAVDIDNEKECDVARRCFEVWTSAQQKRVREIYGDFGLPEFAGAGTDQPHPDPPKKSEGS